MKNLKHMLMIVLIMYWPAQSLAQPTGAAFVGWGFNPTRELVASPESAWVTSNPPYLAENAVVQTQQKKSTWVGADTDLQGYIKDLIRLNAMGYSPSYNYEEKGALGIPRLTIEKSVDFNESESKPRRALSFGDQVCAYLDVKLGAVGAWGPECKITKWLKKPQGKLEKMTENLAKQIGYYNEGDKYRDGDYFYTAKSRPAGLWRDSARYIIENGEGKKVEVVFNISIEKRVDCTKVYCESK